MYELANELERLNQAEELPVSVCRFWPNFPNEGSYLSMEAEIDDGGTIIRIDECGTGWKVWVSRWIFGDCWDTAELGFTATLLHAWQRVYEFLNGHSFGPLLLIGPDDAPMWDIDLEDVYVI